ESVGSHIPRVILFGAIPAIIPVILMVPAEVPIVLVDLLPPRKRFRDSYSLEDSREEHMEIGTADAEVVADLGIGDAVGAYIEDVIGMGVEIAASDIREDAKEFEAEASAEGMMEIAVDLLRSMRNIRDVVKQRVQMIMRMDVVFNGAFGGVRDEEVVVGEGVVVISSSLDMLTNNCLGGIMEEHLRCCQAKGSNDKEKLVHGKMVVKFEVLSERKKMCSLELMMFD
nr:hypothetical protein [Tanacetum cinerariifolium]